MKCLSFIFGLVSLSLICSGAQAMEASKPPSAEQQLGQQIEALRQAMIDGNAAQLDTLAAAKLSYGHSSGLMENKAEFIAKLASGQSDFVTMELTNQQIRIVGDVALVRHDLHADIKDNGTPNRIHLGVLLVWQLQNGQWQLLARQAFKYPPQPQ